MKAPTLRRGQISPDPRPCFETRLTGNGFYVVSVVRGPRDLLCRATAEEALVEGALYLAKNYRWSDFEGKWVSR